MWEAPYSGRIFHQQNISILLEKRVNNLQERPVDKRKRCLERENRAIGVELGSGSLLELLHGCRLVACGRSRRERVALSSLILKGLKR